MTIYLSGRMSGIPTHEFEAEFAYWQTYYEAKGFTVISPVELDGGDYTWEKREYLSRDLAILLGTGLYRVINSVGSDKKYDRVDRIYMLPSWRGSEGGCRLEKFAAETVGIPVYDAATEKPLEKLPVKVMS